MRSVNAFGAVAGHVTADVLGHDPEDVWFVCGLALWALGRGLLRNRRRVNGEEC